MQSLIKGLSNEVKAVMKLKNLITNKHANEIMSLNAKVKMQQD